MFLWTVAIYFSKAKGWGVGFDGNHTLICHMGIGTNISVMVIQKLMNRWCTMFRLVMRAINCPEVFLAEKHWVTSMAEMVRFARTGGEANAIAIRIARAASEKTMAIWVISGWHDCTSKFGKWWKSRWPPSSGLEPKGVPRNLWGTVYPFRYNEIKELETLVIAWNWSHQDGGFKNEGPEPISETGSE